MPTKIDWSALDKDAAAAKLAEIRAKMLALNTKHEAYEAAKKAGGVGTPLTNAESAELTELTAALIEGKTFEAVDPAAAVKAAQDALTAGEDAAKTGEIAKSTEGDKPAGTKAEGDKGEGGDEPKTPTAEELKALVGDLETQLAAAQAAATAGVTDNNSEAAGGGSGGEGGEVSARAALTAVSTDGHGTAVEVTDNFGIAAAFAAATSPTNHKSGVILETRRFDPATTAMVTGENELADYQVIVAAQAAHIEAMAQAACSDGCADECSNIVNAPAEVFCPKPTPFQDRMFPIPAKDGCTATAWIANKPMTDDAFYTFVLCDDSAEEGTYVSGWTDVDDAFTEQTVTAGVPADKPSETLDVDCFSKVTKQHAATFWNGWVRESDQLCKPTQTRLALDRKMALLQAQIEAKVIADATADALAGGHVYTADSSAAGGQDAVIELAAALQAFLPGESEAWCVDLSRYTAVWSQGLDAFINIGRYRSGSSLPALREVLDANGINIAAGFESAVPLPGATPPTWHGTPAAAMPLTATEILTTQVHTLLLVDFSILGKFVGPTRNVTVDNDSRAIAKSASFVQFADSVTSMPVGPVPLISLTFTACNSGITTERAEFTACVPTTPPE